MTAFRWSLGTIIGLPLLALLFLACLVVGVWGLWAWRGMGKGETDRGIVLSFSISGFLCALLVVAGTAWGMWPYSGEYHQWRDTSGTVQAIDSRLVGADKSTTERFVVTFDDGRQRSCDDTRCAQVEEGDVLTLACKRAWQWSGTHGFDCNYISHEVTR